MAWGRARVESAAADATGRARRPGPSLLARGLQALSRREYGRAELERKLAAHAESEEALQAVLEQLQAKGFLSDERAAASVVRQKAPRFGSARIRQDLLAKGLDRDLVDATLAPLQDDELARAHSVWQAKFGKQPASALDWPARQKERARQLRFMAARGFSPEVVRQLLRALQESGSDDDGDGAALY